MRESRTPSRFIEILDPKATSPTRLTAWDVRLEDVLAHQEAVITRSRSSTQSSGKDSGPGTGSTNSSGSGTGSGSGSGSDRESASNSPPSPSSSSPGNQRWKRISNILTATRRGSA